MNETFRQRWSWCLCGWLLWCGALCADEPAGEREKLVKEAFRKADRNNDGNLTPEEFVGLRQPAAVFLRDFQLFDFDQDGQLSLAEFDPIAFGVEQDKRGPVRDLIKSIVDDFVAEFDRDFDDWDSRPDEKIPLRGRAGS